MDEKACISNLFLGNINLNQSLKPLYVADCTPSLYYRYIKYKYSGTKQLNTNWKFNWLELFKFWKLVILSHFCRFFNSKGGRTPFFSVFVSFMYKHIGCTNFGTKILRIKEKLKFLELFNILTKNITFRAWSSLGAGKRIPKNPETIFFKTANIIYHTHIQEDEKIWRKKLKKLPNDQIWLVLWRI